MKVKYLHSLKMALDLNNICSDDSITVTQLDCIPTQDLVIEPVTESSRFENVNVENDQSIQKRKVERLSQNTRKQNCWAIAAYIDWAKWRNNQAETLLGDQGLIPGNLHTESAMTIDYWLSRFSVECRRKKPYPPNTLYNLSASIQRTFRENYGRHDVNLLDTKDKHFAEFRKSLDGRTKELTGQGVGIHRQRADPVTEEDERKLWDAGVIGIHSSKSLSFAVFFYNCKGFGFRGGDEHRKLDASQYTLITENGRKALVFHGRSSKNDQGGLNQRKVEPKLTKQFESSNENRCIVRLFECIPPSGPFYRRPLPPNATCNIFFSSQVVGINVLGKYMQSMFKEAEIDTTGRNIRNHSRKVTLRTSMYKQGFDEQAIMGRSGHRSTAVRDYKRPSSALLQSVSDALQPPEETVIIPPKKVKSEAVVASSSNDSKSVLDSIDSESVLEINVPDCIDMVIVSINGKKVSVTL